MASVLLVTIAPLTTEGIIWIAAIAFAGFFAWSTLRRHDFLIIVSGKEVSYRGRFPPGIHASTTQFFAQDLALPGRYRVIGRWRPGRVLELRFRGDLPAIHRQRVRNFLAMTLKSG
jgi:hypothetical protein